MQGLRSCALVGASDFNASEFRARFAAGAFDVVYAVDGGFRWLQQLGVRAHLAVGDFDSLGRMPEGVPVEEYSPLKDASDMELALERAWLDGCRQACIFGGLGRRLDHTIANLQVMARFSEQGMQVEAVHDAYAVRMLTGPAAFQLPVRPWGGTVSVFSMSDCARGVTERGLRYSLDEAPLRSRTSLGLSNELLSQSAEPASVAVEEGTLAIIYPLE